MKLLGSVFLTLVFVGGAMAETKPPTPKSADETKALQAMFQAGNDPNAQIVAAQNVLEKFADTEFKAIALEMITNDYDVLNNFEKAVVFGERTLEANPQSFNAMLVLARQYARNTKDTDFDRDEKLKKADKYAHDSITASKAAEKISPQISDTQWASEKKFVESSAHEVLGMLAMIKKKPADAATEFQASLDASETPNPATYVRLAEADNLSGKYDQAIAAADKAMSASDAPVVVKQIAQAQKARAVQKKTAGASPGASTTSAAPAASAVPATSAVPPSVK